MDEVLEDPAAEDVIVEVTDVEGKTISNKITNTTSNKKVATVSSKGVIKANKERHRESPSRPGRKQRRSK